MRCSSLFTYIRINMEHFKHDLSNKNYCYDKMMDALSFASLFIDDCEGTMRPNIDRIIKGYALKVIRNEIPYLELLHADELATHFDSLWDRLHDIGFSDLSSEQDQLYSNCEDATSWNFEHKQQQLIKKWESQSIIKPVK